MVRDGELTATLEMENPPEDNIKLLRAVIVYVAKTLKMKASSLIASEILKEIGGTVKVRGQEYDWGTIKHLTD